MSVQQEVGQSRVTAGVDWAERDHAVAIVDQHRDEAERLTVAHTAPDLRRMVTRLPSTPPCRASAAVEVPRPAGSDGVAVVCQAK